MALTSADFARLGPAAQKQVMDKLLALEDLTGMTFRELFGECKGRR